MPARVLLLIPSTPSFSPARTNPTLRPGPSPPGPVGPKQTQKGALQHSQLSARRTLRGFPSLTASCVSETAPRQFSPPRRVAEFHRPAPLCRPLRPRLFEMPRLIHHRPCRPRGAGCGSLVDTVSSAGQARYPQVHGACNFGSRRRIEGPWMGKGLGIWGVTGQGELENVGDSGNCAERAADLAICCRLQAFPSARMRG